jgi:Lecithin retinol acyltransferase
MTHLCNCDVCQCSSHDVALQGPAHDTTNEATGARSRGSRPGKQAGHRPTKICEGTTELREPPLGAHLITPRRGYTHHGIYAGGGTVIHYAGLSRSIRRGPVAQVHLAEFANGQAVHVECRSERALDEREILARARSRLGESRYRLLTNNCEHFSEWSRFGVSRSRQVDRWFGLPIFAVRGLALMVKQGRSAFRSAALVGRVAA